MDFGLTEEQEMLRKSARDFLEKEWPGKMVREMEKSKEGYSPELWRKMAQLGWMGLVFPEKYGGTGGDFLNLVVLLEEMGRALLTGPFTSSIIHCGMSILEAGTEEQKKEFLPGIARGELILALAFTEPSGGYDATSIAVTATPDKDDYILNGTKLFVSNAHIADYLLCVARTKNSRNPENGITLFLVDTKSPGISSALLRTVAEDKQCEVVFKDVRVPAKNMLGKLNSGWPVVEKVFAYGAIGECAQMVGGAQKVLEMTTQYAKERVQFGRPIGSFQAVQHALASMVPDIDASRYLTWEAAWRISQGLPCAMEVSVAKAWTSEAYRRVCSSGHQIHGAIGFSLNHDMQLYFRRAKEMELAFGDADFHKERVAGNLEQSALIQ